MKVPSPEAKAVKAASSLVKLKTSKKDMSNGSFTKGKLTAKKSAKTNKIVKIKSSDLPLINGRSAIIISGIGFIKRVALQNFRTQSRGGKGKAGVKLPRDEETVTHFFSCNDYDTLLFATDTGFVYSAKAYQIPELSRFSKGKEIHEVIQIPDDSKVTAVIPVESFDSTEETLVLLTGKGYMKKTPLKQFEKVTGHGLIMSTLEPGDTLQWVRKCQPEDNIIVATKNGNVSRFPSSDLTITTRKSRGVRAVKLRDGDCLADMDVLHLPRDGLPPSLASTGAQHRELFLLIITERGYGKRLPVCEVNIASRGCRGTSVIKFKARFAEESSSSSNLSSSSSSSSSFPDAVSCLRGCTPSDEVVLVTRKGTIIRQRISDISVQSRVSSGVLVQCCAKDGASTDRVILADIVAPYSDLDAVPVDFAQLCGTDADAIQGILGLEDGLALC